MAVTVKANAALGKALNKLLRVKEAELLEKANDQVQNGQVKAVLMRAFGRVTGSVLFELIGIGQKHEDELDIEYVEEA